MFDERRQTTVKGIDRSYPLEPLENKLRKQTNGVATQRNGNLTVNRQSVNVRRVARADVNSNVNNGKPVVSYHEEITRESFEPPTYRYNDEDEYGLVENRVGTFANGHYRHDADYEVGCARKISILHLTLNLTLSFIAQNLFSYMCISCNRHLSWWWKANESSENINTILLFHTAAIWAHGSMFLFFFFINNYTLTFWLHAGKDSVRSRDNREKSYDGENPSNGIWWNPKAPREKRFGERRVSGISHPGYVRQTSEEKYDEEIDSGRSATRTIQECKREEKRRAETIDFE